MCKKKNAFSIIALLLQKKVEGRHGVSTEKMEKGEEVWKKVIGVPRAPGRTQCRARIISFNELLTNCLLFQSFTKLPCA